MSVNVTELQENLSKYIALAATEDVFITQDDKVVAKLSNPQRDRVKTAESLFGILPQTTTWEEAKEERLGTI
ncbi:MAG: type II toxin-antitoxin system prevent-host-death family antitoxin [Schwartzia sp.]|nr:type II toxin-antitoxin system prevent-host-death family antitoxin [Schwartzia sp. (in: firmicutes)]